MKLSRNFDSEEFEKTGTGLENKIPDMQILTNIANLVKYVLQPVRNSLGVPIHINSGYRSEQVNKAVGGVEKSQHRQGKAADISTENKKDMEKLRDLLEKTNFDQLIVYRSFIHVSYNIGENRNQIIYKNK